MVTALVFVLGVLCCLGSPSFAAAEGLKISAGSVAGLHEFPSTVQLHVYMGELVAKCAGSIISPNLILSSAHCLDSIPVLNPFAGYYIQVVAGAWMWGSLALESQTRNVSDYMRPRAYDENTNHNDLAILVLDSPFRLNQYVQSIGLPHGPAQIFDGTAQIVGWGAKSDNENPLGIVIYVLRKADVPLLPGAVCMARLRNASYVYNHTIMTCAGGNGADTCRGDSGGPLICTSGGGAEKVLCGITSWGNGTCGQPGMPSAYTRVSSYVEWIKQKISEYDDRGSRDTSGSCPGQFDCGNGRCIPVHQVCNLYNDCGTGLDEAGCGSCESDEFRCGTHFPIHRHQCIPLNYVCDYSSDCDSGADEMGCGKCNSTTFLCANSKCLPRECDPISLVLDTCYAAQCQNISFGLGTCAGVRKPKCVKDVAGSCALSVRLCDNSTATTTSKPYSFTYPYVPKTTTTTTVPYGLNPYRVDAGWSNTNRPPPPPTTITVATTKVASTTTTSANFRRHEEMNLDRKLSHLGEFDSKPKSSLSSADGSESGSSSGKKEGGFWGSSGFWALLGCTLGIAATIGLLYVFKLTRRKRVQTRPASFPGDPQVTVALM